MHEKKENAITVAITHILARIADADLNAPHSVRTAQPLSFDLFGARARLENHLHFNHLLRSIFEPNDVNHAWLWGCLNIVSIAVCMCVHVYARSR